MRILALGLAAAVATTPVAASAATYVVDAFANSSSGGTALATGLIFSPGQKFRIISSVNDLWSAGALPRYSDANGLTADRFKTAQDDAVAPIGTKIGQNFGPYTQGNLTAAFGSLVAETGTNTYQLLGANGIFTSQGGELRLAYFDSNNGDNFGSITFDITAVPEPATWGMMILGFGLIGAVVRRRRTTVSFATA